MPTPLIFDDSGGSEEPVVFINGLFQTITSWTTVKESLSRYSRVIRIDLVNQGGSRQSEGSYSPDAHAHDVVDLLNNIGCEGVHLLGHSYGTRIAIRAARLLGDRTRTLILVGASSPSLRERYLMIFRNWRRAILAGDSQAIIDAVVPWVYGGHYLQENEGLISFYANHLAEALKDGRALKNLEGLIASYEDFHPEQESGNGVRARTLILNGAEDAVTPPSCLKSWSKTFFNASIVLAPHTGHALVAERPDLVEEEILKIVL